MQIKEWELMFPKEDNLEGAVNTIRNLVTFFDYERMLATDVDSSVGCRIRGFIYGNPKYPNGCEALTSPIVRVERKPLGNDGTGFTFVTQSGSRYDFAKSGIGVFTVMAFDEWRAKNSIRLSRNVFY